MKLFKDIEFKEHHSIENAIIGTITLTNGFDAVLLANVKTNDKEEAKSDLKGDVIKKGDKTISENYQFEIYQNELNDDDAFEIELGKYSLSNVTPEEIDKYLTKLQELGHEKYRSEMMQAKRDRFFNKLKQYVEK